MGNPLFAPTPVVFHTLGKIVVKFDPFFIFGAAGNSVDNTCGTLKPVYPVRKIFSVFVPKAVDHANVKGIKSHDPVNGLLRIKAQAAFQLFVFGVVCYIQCCRTKRP